MQAHILLLSRAVVAFVLLANIRALLEQHQALFAQTVLLANTQLWLQRYWTIHATAAQPEPILQQEPQVVWLARQENMPIQQAKRLLV